MFDFSMARLFTRKRNPLPASQKPFSVLCICSLSLWRRGGGALKVYLSRLPYLSVCVSTSVVCVSVAVSSSLFPFCFVCTSASMSFCYAIGLCELCICPPACAICVSVSVFD